MAEEIKLSKFDNEPWGFRLTGGKDFGTILTIIKVSQSSLAEKADLRVGDLLLAINGQPLTAMTHSEAHEEIIRAGNNFVFTLVRGSVVKPPQMMKFNDFSTCDNTQQEKAIEINDESKLEEELLLINEKEDRLRALGAPVPVTPPSKIDLEELEGRAPEAKKEHRPEHEQQEMMLGHAQVISGNMIGVDFYKMAPKCEVIGKSGVLKAIQEEKKTDAKKSLSKFLQQPDRPVVKPKQEPLQNINSYRPVIKIPRKGEQTVENTESQEHSETDKLTTQNKTEDQTAIENKTEEESNTTQPDSEHDQSNSEEVTNLGENEVQTEQSSEEQINNPIEEISMEEVTAQDKNDIDSQLLKINEQLANLMCMPQEMQRYLLQVKKQIAHIIQIKNENQDMPKEESNPELEVEASTEPQETDTDNQISNEESNNTEEERTLNDTNSASGSRELPAADQLPATADDSEEAKVKEDGPLTEVTEQQDTEEQEGEKPRRDIKWQKEPPVKNRPFFLLTPKPRPIVVPGDVFSIANEGMFSEDFIAETLTGNAEVILGRAIGNNFLKFKKNYDHLQLSSVYKMVHQDDKSIFPSRSGKLPSKDDYLQSAEATNI